MQNSLTEISSDCIQTVMDGLRKNNMDVQYVPHKEEAAVYRVKTVTVPAIVKRRGLDAPCARLGRCIAADQKNMASGCMCDARRCCNYLVLGRQRVKGRIKVILVGETLGF